MPGHSFKTSAKRTGWKGLNFGVTLTKLFSCSDSAAVEAKKVINNYNRKKIDRKRFSLYPHYSKSEGAERGHSQL